MGPTSASLVPLRQRGIVSTKILPAKALQSPILTCRAPSHPVHQVLVGGVEGTMAAAVGHLEPAVLVLVLHQVALVTAVAMGLAAERSALL
jgi:hypothetical protein